MSSITLGTKLEYDRVAFKKKHTLHLLVNLKGGQIEGQKRDPLNLVVAIDCSGSMGEEGGRKIEYAKKTLVKLIEHLTEEDRLGILGFSDHIFTVSEPRKMTQDAKDRMKVEVGRLHPMNCTNLSGATLEAMQMMKDSEGRYRVFLLTDGLPTSGITDHAELVDLVEKNIGSASLTCFGYGANYNAELLESMARKGRGNMYHVTTPDECPAFFGRELGGLLSCVAQGVKVTLKSKPDVKILEVLNDFEVKGNPDNTEAVISVDDVYALENRRILVKLELPEMDKGGRPFKLADVKVEFQDLLAKTQATEEASVKIEYVKEEEAQKEADKEVLEQIALIEAAEAQEKARDLANQGDFSSAQKVLSRAQNMCMRLGTVFACRVADDLGSMQGWIKDHQAWAKGGAHYLHANVGAYRSSRGSTSGSCQMFSTQAQDDMAVSFADPGQIPIVHDSGSSRIPPVELKLKTLSKKRKRK